MDGQEHRLAAALTAIHAAATALKEQRDVFDSIEWSTIDRNQLTAASHAVTRANKHSEALVDKLVSSLVELGEVH